MISSDLSLLSRTPALLRLWRAMGEPEAWVTGGSVRDRLLGLPVHDVDLVVPGTLESTRDLAVRLARALGGHAHALGRAPRAVWRIEGGTTKAEIWPLGTLDLQADALRRDFTVNAMLWRLPRGPLVDPAGGLEDLRRRRLRAVSRRNLEDDPVRILRAPRFAAQLPGFSVERRTLAWLRELAPLLGRAPRERVGQELERLLEAPDPARGWRILARCGALATAAPPGSRLRPGGVSAGAEALALLADPGRHPLPAALRRQGPEARLGLLLWAWGAPAEGDLGAYGWPRPKRRAAALAARLAEEATAAVEADWRSRRRLLHRAGPEAPAVLALAAALHPHPPAGWRRFWRLWRRRGRELAAPVPLLASDEIRRLTGLPPGPELGAAIRALIEAQVDARVRTAASARRFLLERLGAPVPAPPP